jgi:hypothetical protein
MADHGGFYWCALAGIVGEERARRAVGNNKNEEEALDTIEAWFKGGGGAEDERAEFMRRANMVSPIQNDGSAAETMRQGVDTISRRLFATGEVAGSPLDEFEMSP